MKVTFELSGGMLPLLPREVLEDCLKQVLNNSVPNLGHNYTSVCVPESAASIPENYNHTEGRFNSPILVSWKQSHSQSQLSLKKPNKLFRQFQCNFRRYYKSMCRRIIKWEYHWQIFVGNII